MQSQGFVYHPQHLVLVLEGVGPLAEAVQQEVNQRKVVRGPVFAWITLLLAFLEGEQVVVRNVGVEGVLRRDLEV